MVAILNVPVAGAVTAQVGPSYQLRGNPGSGVTPTSIAAQGTCVGTVGTTMAWWLQTSFDGGTTWCDAIAASHAAAGRLNGIVLSSPAAGVNPVAPTDGTATPPLAINGMYADLWRVKYTTTGTWTGGNLRVDIFSNGVEPSA
jgi:hypothetical protein